MSPNLCDNLPDSFECGKVRGIPTVPSWHSSPSTSVSGRWRCFQAGCAICPVFTPLSICIKDGWPEWHQHEATDGLCLLCTCAGVCTQSDLIPADFIGKLWPWLPFFIIWWGASKAVRYRTTPDCVKVQWQVFVFHRGSHVMDCCIWVHWLPGNKPDRRLKKNEIVSC